MEHEKQNLIYLNLQRIRSLLKFAGPSTCLIDATQAGGSAAVFALRSEVNIELNFPPKLRGARSRLYRRGFLQVNTRWRALAEIYTMHSNALLCTVL